MDLTSKMANVSLTGPILPTRPGFGTHGGDTILWANYFKLNPTVKSLYRYDLRVSDKKMTPKEGEETAAKAQPTHKGHSESKDKQAKGRKLEIVIKLALEKLGKAVVATEYKQQLITREKLKLPEDGNLQVEIVESGRKDETWFVRFDGPTSVDVGALMDYLKVLEDPSNDAVFPKFPDEIDALGVVLGHTPRSDSNITSVGRNRFFAADRARRDVAPGMERSMLDIYRGYFQSVRPATGRLLLNTNVSHGVFRKDLSLAEPFERMGLTKLNTQGEPPEYITATVRKVAKILSKSRIKCKIPTDKPGEFTEQERTMAGLGTPRDGSGEENRPQFQYPGRTWTCPSNTRFYLRPPSDPAKAYPGLAYGSHVLVSDYFKTSKSAPPVLCRPGGGTRPD